MAPRKTKAVSEFTTETFAKHIQTQMKKGDKNKLADAIVAQWGLALFELPVKEVNLVRDYLLDHEPKNATNAHLSAVVHSL